MENKTSYFSKSSTLWSAVVNYFPTDKLSPKEKPLWNDWQPRASRGTSDTYLCDFCRVSWWALWGRWAAGRVRCSLPSLGSSTGKQPPSSAPTLGSVLHQTPSPCCVVDTFFRGQRYQGEEDLVHFLREFSIWKGEDSQESEL